MTEPDSNQPVDGQPPEVPTNPASVSPSASAAAVSCVAEHPEPDRTSVLSWIWKIPTNIAIFLVRIYQWTLSPIVGRQCRFHPSCSNYYILAVRKYGFLSGSCRGFWRICRCNPFCRGGEDFP